MSAETFLGSPVAAEDNPAAGRLTLPGGRTYPVLPEVLAFSGQARFEYPNGRSLEGIWQQGKLEGVGKEISAQGTYTGQWHQGLRHGHGEYVAADGTRYVGAFANGQAEGKGTLTTADGVYRGQFQGGQRTGEGHFKSHDGAVYEGLWFADERSGVGEQIYANNTVYRGEWQADRPHGFGEQRLVDGTFYDGQFTNGLRHGYGTYRIADKVGYDGMWRAGRRDGYGAETLPDGSVYRGWWVAGQRSGRGREVRLDGTFHDGEWEANRVMGNGVRRNSSGVTLAGAWLNDTISTGLLTLPDGVQYAGPLFNRRGEEVAAPLLNWLTKQARAQNPYAQLILASAYLDFVAPPPEPEVARVWLQRSAEAGVREAQYRLATLQFEQDQQQALALLALAAAQEHKSALERLGQLYQTGQFLTRDLPRAITYYEHAIALGSPLAANNLAWLLATTQSPELVDPERSINLIRPHVLYYENWQHMDTLAAGLARKGQFAAAVNILDECLARAQSEADQTTYHAIELRREIYARGKPFIEEDAAVDLE